MAFAQIFDESHCTAEATDLALEVVIDPHWCTSLSKPYSAPGTRRPCRPLRQFSGCGIAPASSRVSNCVVGIQPVRLAFNVCHVVLVGFQVGLQALDAASSDESSRVRSHSAISVDSELVSTRVHELVLGVEEVLLEALHTASGHEDTQVSWDSGISVDSESPPLKEYSQSGKKTEWEVLEAFNSTSCYISAEGVIDWPVLIYHVLSIGSWHSLVLGQSNVLLKSLDFTCGDEHSIRCCHCSVRVYVILDSSKLGNSVLLRLNASLKSDDTTRRYKNTITRSYCTVGVYSVLSCSKHGNFILILLNPYLQPRNSSCSHELPEQSSHCTVAVNIW